MKLSIIIPVYEPDAHDITRCLDSIFTSGLPADDFEVICVDDCSPTDNPRRLITGYKVSDRIHPANLTYLRLPRNSRQGGARNAGVAAARGQWISYIDQDDYYSPDGLPSLMKALTENPELDILMTTAAKVEDGVVKPFVYADRNNDEVMTGSEFINTQEVPWCPWNYIYRRNFLTENGLKFEENVRFEDVDYVMAATLSARRMRFLPIDLIRHVMTETQTTFIGNDYERIEALVNMADRTRRVSERFEAADPAGAKAVFGHYLFEYNAFLRRFAWRLPAAQCRRLLKQYPPYRPDTPLMRLAVRPAAFAAVAAAARPLLLAAWRLKRRLRR